MARSMKYRSVEQALLRHNCTWKPGNGSHIKWYCPCGEHIAVVPQAGTVSAAGPGTSPAGNRKKNKGTGKGKGKSPARGPAAMTTITTKGSATYTVAAKRWKHGWELHIDGIGVTQSKTLAAAEQMVRDYIETLTDQDVSDAQITITPELGLLGEKVRTVRAKLADAERAQREAAAAKRQLTDDLRAAGMSVSDTAVILGVSRGRVSQLLSSKASKA